MDDDFEKQRMEYYDRKVKRAEEIIPYLGWLAVILFVAMLLHGLWQLVARLM